MKYLKKFLLSILIVILAAVVIAGGTLTLRFFNSPEYALMQTVKDIQENGITALNAHCTEEFSNKLEKAFDFTGSGLIGSLIFLFTDTDKILEAVRENADKIEWSVSDIIKSKNKATAVIGFDYDNGSVIGTLDIDMIKDGKQWKISDIDYPEFEHFEW